MIYLPKRITKFYLILLSALIFFHLSFISETRYSAYLERNSNQEDFRLTDVTEEQYNVCLYSLQGLTYQIEFIKNTEVKSIFDSTKSSILFIYFGYFIISVAFIFSAKTNLTLPNNETK